MQKIICATGDKSINIAVDKFEGYVVIKEVEFRSEIKKACTENLSDILLLTEGVLGKESLPEIIISILKHQPQLRIVFLTGEIDFNHDGRQAFFEALVYAGVYDILHENQITPYKIKHLLDHPKKREDVGYLVKNKRSKVTSFVFSEDQKQETQVEEHYSNLFTISSIKPGTGKSFVSANVATMIASFGEKNNKGQPPRVALIEADLQNLSLGTLLQIEDDKKNLKTAMDQIGTIISPSGNLIMDVEKIENVNKHIKEGFRPYLHAKNLEALVGSHLSLQEFEDVKAIHYIYLIDTIVKDYDVVIVDTNSALTHITTYPLLNMAKYCYYILNLDYNNIRNNYRYRGFLEKLNVLNRVKYVLNENLTREQLEEVKNETLMYTLNMIEKDFKLESKIPVVPKVMFLNRIYSGKPIIYDKSDETLEIRYEIAKIANQLWPIKNMKKLESEMAVKRGEKKKGLFFNR